MTDGRPEGERSYYSRLIFLALPIALQHLITVSLNLIDNIMIGRLGPLPLAAVGSANQLYSIYEMILFGLLSGAAVSVAQYFGAKDFRSIRKIIGMDVTMGVTLGMFTMITAQLFAPQIIGLFASEPEVIKLGTEYIRIASLTYLTIPVSFTISFNSRSVQMLKIPTIINVCSILTNTVLNYMMIYGNFGMPAMGVRGAALATLIARILEMTALIVYLLTDKRHPFHGKLSEFRGFSKELFLRVMRTAMPVVVSEGGWSLGITLTFAAYGKINAEALAVMQVSNVLCSLCQCTSFAVGNASAALTGQILGEGNKEAAFENGKKYMRVQWTLNVMMTVMILLLRKPIAVIYDFDAETTRMLMLSLGVFAFTLIPRMVAYAVQCGLLRAGGDTYFCMIVELSCNLGLEVILAYFSVLVLGLPLHLCIAVAASGNLLKAIVEYRRFYSKKWIHIVI